MDTARVTSPSSPPRVFGRRAATSCVAVVSLVSAALAWVATTSPRVALADPGANTQVAELYQLQAAFHTAVSNNGDVQDAADHLELLSTLWAPDATLTSGGTTISGRDNIVAAFAAGGPFHNDWVALTPISKSRFETHGNTAEIYFECIYVDPDTDTVVSKRSLFGTAKKVNGDWNFWHMQGAVASL